MFCPLVQSFRAQNPASGTVADSFSSSSCWGIVGTIFNFFIKRRWTGWWLNYNYVTSAALDCGLIVSTLVIFFCLQLTGAQAPVWFGNDEALNTLDMNFQAIQTVLPKGQTFGPTDFP